MKLTSQVSRAMGGPPTYEQVKHAFAAILERTSTFTILLGTESVLD